MTSRLFRSGIVLPILAALFLVIAATALVQEKDLDSIRTIYLTPIEGGTNSARFQAVLKSELVHNGFAVVPKAEKADAVLTVEVTLSSGAGKNNVETSAMLENAAHSMIWSGGRTKSGDDLDKLVNAEARNIASAIRLAKDDLITKNQEKDKKKPHQ
ncbi:MAG: hypothetical protein HYX26_00935 [Acidobacteriales bacterium]|nr:hypothetical protein [Terriglobales bacterium]